ncbi:phospholipase [Achlya hypogyna]|uniref:Phospholipase n=1 Tax=Achlya hypogyna TaxID=1202772 RepID=A0A1V9Z4N0_ACHHY|nr:phospholipase [Achlya hypogyna]
MATKQQLTGLIVIAAAWLLTTPIGQGFFVYLNFPAHLWIDFADPPLEYTTNVYVNSSDGVAIGLWHTHLPRPRGKVLLYLHGNGEHRGAAVGIVKHHLYTAMPSVSDIVMVDYRGFGDSSRVWPTEIGVKDDALAAWNWVTAGLGHAPRDVIVHGYSLGSAIATYLVHTVCAKNQCPAGLVLEAPFTTIAGIAQDWVPLLSDAAASSLLAHQFRTKDILPQLNTTPILLVHGKRDRIVAFHHGQQLFDEHPHSNIRFCPVETAGHMNSFEFKEAQQCLLTFWQLLSR